MSDWAKQQIRKAWSYKEHGNLDNAIKTLKTAIKQEPENGALWLQLGGMQLDKDEPQEAEISMRIALKKDGDSAMGYCVLGRSLRKQGRNLEAVEMFTRSAELQPFDFTLVYLSEAHLRCENLVEAEIAAREALKIDPTCEETYQLLAEICTNDEAEKAVEYLNKAISLNPDYAAAHRELGTKLIHLERYEEAIVSLHKAISIVSDDVWCYMYLGNALHHLKRLDEAEAEFRKAVDVDPDHYAAHLALADFLKGRGKTKAAEERYRSSIGAYAENPVALYCFSRFLFHEDRIEEARIYAEKALELDPDDGKLRILLKNIRDES